MEMRTRERRSFRCHRVQFATEGKNIFRGGSFCSVSISSFPSDSFYQMDECKLRDKSGMRRIPEAEAKGKLPVPSRLNDTHSTITDRERKRKRKRKIVKEKQTDRQTD
uniref:Uncharacterized protein n=1 Tax=Physcomitrium patens TaxID=3218 RepID=A0A2K1KMI1_PHYPA|nr:hypothetical protein PHYPA_005881 [Physcomitrium patens]